MKANLWLPVFVTFFVLSTSGTVQAVKIEFDNVNSTGSVSMAVSVFAGQNSDSDAWQYNGILYNNGVAAYTSNFGASSVAISSVSSSASDAYPEPGKETLIYDFCFYQNCQGSPSSYTDQEGNIFKIPATFSSILDVTGTVYWRLLPSTEDEKIGTQVIVCLDPEYSVGSNSGFVTYEMGIYDWEWGIEPNIFGPYEVMTCIPGEGFNNYPHGEDLSLTARLGDTIRLSYHIKVNGHTTLGYALASSSYKNSSFGHSIRMPVYIEWPPECAFSAKDPVWQNEADEMVLPYDEVDLKFEFTNTAPNPVSNVRVKFLSKSDLIEFTIGSTEIGYVPSGGTFAVINKMKIAGTNNPRIMSEIIEAGRQARLPLQGEIMEVWVTADECPAPHVFTELVPVDENGNILAIQYPNFWKLASDDGHSPPTPPDIGGYYQRGGGDLDFHHFYDAGVREYAVKAAVYDDDVFPDSLPDIMFNIYRFVDDHVLNYESGPCYNDIQVVGQIKGGIPHHICMTQAYLLTSFARTIGLPARELDVARGVSLIETYEPGVFQIGFGQEAAVQVWYDGDWHLYDTFLHLYDTFLGKRSLEGYLDRECIKYRAWYSYDRRSDPVPSTLSLLGHDFRINEYLGTTGLFSGWKHLQDGGVEGFIVRIASPVHTYLLDAQSNATGYIDGRVVEEIPGSYYLPAGTRISTNRADSSAFWEADETIFVARSGQPGGYSLVVTGTDNGHYELILAYVHQDGEIDGSTIQFYIRKDETHTYDITVSPSGEISVAGIPARIDVDPDTINLSAAGKWVTCYIELPEALDLTLIDSTLVTLNGVPAYIGKEGWASSGPSKGNIIDHDGDGILSRMVKFNRSVVASSLAPGEATLALQGGMIDGTIFEGTATVTVIDRGTRANK